MMTSKQQFEKDIGWEQETMEYFEKPEANQMPFNGFSWKEQYIYFLYLLDDLSVILTSMILSMPTT